jgi:hypothetical protein
MSPLRTALSGLTIALLPLLGACTSKSGPEEGGEHSGEHSGEHGGERSEGRGEHDRDGSEHGGEHGNEGEESGTELGLTETYDATRGGARLVLAYDADAKAFTGTVENTTERTLEAVRVEVHLNNGKELGPTPAADLAPGEKRSVELAATGAGFDRWNAHPEVGRGEHGHGEGGEGHGEH